MRSITCITLLVSLFIFQSLWNVAAAFCVHERSNTQASYSTHFGHHQTQLCVNTQHQDENNTHPIASSDENKINVPLGEDHQDHLPSMTHIILQTAQTNIQPFMVLFKDQPEFNWQNFYQPPDLSRHSPPPEFSPLMVG